jgi:REP element-mobilizing transposase RayT
MIDLTGKNLLGLNNYFMQPLEYGKYYHIYNRGINGEALFTSQDNYLYFLRLYNKYLSNIVDTYTWCLMNNHFHFLVQIKELDAIKFEVKNPERFIYQQFSNFFNAYSKFFNKRELRHGALFDRLFRRKLIQDEEYLKNLILYIHLNPIHHNLVENVIDYFWSSYKSILSLQESKISRDKVLEFFEGKENLVFVHQQKKSVLNLENW